TTWLTILLLSLATGFGTVVFLVAVRRGVSRPLGSVVHALTELAAGNTDAEVSGAQRGDEIGQVADALHLLKGKMIEADRLRAEQSNAEQRQVRQRQADMNGLADRFETAVGEIIDTVTQASGRLEGSARTLTVTAERTQAKTAAVATASD